MKRALLALNDKVMVFCSGQLSSLREFLIDVDCEMTLRSPSVEVINGERLYLRFAGHKMHSLFIEQKDALEVLKTMGFQAYESTLHNVEWHPALYIGDKLDRNIDMWNGQPGEWKYRTTTLEEAVVKLFERKTKGGTP